MTVFSQDSSRVVQKILKNLRIFKKIKNKIADDKKKRVSNEHTWLFALYNGHALAAVYILYVSKIYTYTYHYNVCYLYSVLLYCKVIRFSCALA